MTLYSLQCTRQRSNFSPTTISDFFFFIRQIDTQVRIYMYIQTLIRTRRRYISNDVHRGARRTAVYRAGREIFLLFSFSRSDPGHALGDGFNAPGGTSRAITRRRLKPAEEVDCIGRVQFVCVVVVVGFSRYVCLEIAISAESKSASKRLSLSLSLSGGGNFCARGVEFVRLLFWKGRLVELFFFFCGTLSVIISNW